MNTISSSLVLLLLPMGQVVLAQVNNARWQECIGGSANDAANAMVIDSSGLIHIAGHTASVNGDFAGGAMGGADGFLIRVLDGDNILSTWRYGGSDFDEIAHIAPSIDGGWICVGGSRSTNGDLPQNHGGIDAWALKLGPAGQVEWSVALGGSSDDFASHVCALSSGNYLLLGSTGSEDFDVSLNHGQSDMWFVMIDSVGQILWEKTFGSSGTEHLFSAVAMPDGGVVAIGYTTSSSGMVIGNHGLWDTWVIRVDSVGTLQWQRCIGSSGVEQAFEVVLSTTEDLYVIGTTDGSNDGDIPTSHGGNDITLSRLTSAGDLVWTRCFGGSENDRAKGLFEVDASTLCIGGGTESADGDCTNNYGNYDLWLARLDHDGLLTSASNYGGSLYDAVSAISVDDEGLIVVGETRSNDHDIAGNHGGSDLIVFALHGLVAVPEVDGTDRMEMWFDAITNTVHFTSAVQCTGEYELFALSGSMVGSGKVNGSSVVLPLNDLKVGQYFMRVRTGTLAATLSIALIH